MPAGKVLCGLEQVVRGTAILATAGARLGLVAHVPRPLLCVGWAGDWFDEELHRGLDRLAAGFGRLVGGPDATGVLRCARLSDLPKVLAHAVDVVPFDAVMAVVPTAEQALEFRIGDERVLVVYDGRALYPAWKEVEADLDERRLAALEHSYPTRLRSDDGRRLWLSRLARDDPRLATQVEVEHARWIQGNAWEALLGVIVLGRDQDDLLGAVREAVACCPGVRWGL